MLEGMGALSAVQISVGIHFIIPLPQILLGYLPPETKQWDTVLKQQRYTCCDTINVSSDIELAS